MTRASSPHPQEGSGLIPLSADERAEAVQMLRDGWTPREVCAWIGCAVSQLPDPGPQPEFQDGQGRVTRFAARDTLIVAAFKAGNKQRDIRERFGLSAGAVAGVINRARRDGDLPRLEAPVSPSSVKGKGG